MTDERERTLGVVLRETVKGSQLFGRIARSGFEIKVFLRNPALKNLVFVKGPDSRVNQLRDQISKHRGLDYLYPDMINI